MKTALKNTDKIKHYQKKGILENLLLAELLEKKFWRKFFSLKENYLKSKQNING